MVTVTNTSLNVHSYQYLPKRPPGIGGELVGAIGRLEVDCREADDGRWTISVDEANDAIARAEHVVQVVEQVVPVAPIQIARKPGLAGAASGRARGAAV